jgi:hypothetical protein
MYARDFMAWMPSSCTIHIAVCSSSLLTPNRSVTLAHLPLWDKARRE